MKMKAEFKQKSDFLIIQKFENQQLQNTMKLQWKCNEMKFVENKLNEIRQYVYVVVCLN